MRNEVEFDLWDVIVKVPNLYWSWRIGLAILAVAVLAVWLGDQGESRPVRDALLERGGPHYAGLHPCRRIQGDGKSPPF